MAAMKTNEDKSGFVGTELRALLRRSLLMLRAVVSSSERKFLNPAAAYDEARLEVVEGNTGGRPSTPIAPTP
jgi:hypothetical protein